MEKNDKWICVHNRDEAYLKRYYKSFDTSYHNYRNFPIKDLEKAILLFVKKKYFVIRVGSESTGELKISSDRYFDYSRSNIKSDFMDLFISSKSDLFISNNTGVDAFGILFRKPVLHVGSIPVGAISTYSNKILNTILNHYSISLKRNLNLSEIFEKNLHLGWTNDFFEKKKIRLIKFKPTEILKFTKEAIKIINNKRLSFENKYVGIIGNIFD